VTSDRQRSWPCFRRQSRQRMEESRHPLGTPEAVSDLKRQRHRERAYQRPRTWAAWADSEGLAEVAGARAKVAVWTHRDQQFLVMNDRVALKLGGGNR
jgi:hypothetical protein